MANIWWKEEADRYYERNRERMNPREDLVVKVLSFCGLNPRRVLEVGTANGWRLGSHK